MLLDKKRGRKAISVAFVSLMAGSDYKCDVSGSRAIAIEQLDTSGYWIAVSLKSSC